MPKTLGPRVDGLSHTLGLPGGKLSLPVYLAFRVG
jgi:hypothetical protein